MTEQKDFADGVDTTLLDELGARCFGEQWPIVRALNIRRLRGDNPTPAGYDECMLLISGLRILDKRRST